MTQTSQRLDWQCSLVRRKAWGMIVKLLIPALRVATICVAMLASSHAVAQNRPVVVELFTSQGCSSCPPADRMLGKLANRDDVIALAYHVDYWDYLGWKDTFASRAFTQRQQSYVGHTNRQWITQRLRGKFTPEIVVQGTDSLVGHNQAGINSRISAHAAAKSSAVIRLKRVGNDISVQLEPVGQNTPKVRVLLVRYLPKSTVDVARGENAGKSLTYSHIVTDIDEVAKWNGAAAHSMSIKNITTPAVIMLQEGKAGPIIAAAKLN